MMRDFFTEFVPALVGLFVTVFVLFAVFYWFAASGECAAHARNMRIETTFDFWGGCYVTVKGQKLHISDVVPVERNGVIVFEPKPQVRIGVQQ